MFNGNKSTGTSRMNLATFAIDLEGNKSLLGCQFIGLYNSPPLFPAIKMRDVQILRSFVE
jgi:hypothetical protein